MWLLDFGLQGLCNVEYDINRCLPEPIDQTGISPQFDHFMSLSLQDLTDGVDRLFGIELLQ